MLPTIFTFLVLTIHGCLAFFPWDYREYLFGNGGVSHETQTRDVYNTLLYRYFPEIEELSNNMKRARKTWMNANAEVDGDQHTSAKHFDGENFEGAQTLLATLSDGIVSSLQARNAQDAREKLGQALHTVQDFYSHSNWVELGNTGPHPGVGRAVSIASVSASDATCEGCSGLKLGINSLASRIIPGRIIPGPVDICLDCEHNTDGFSLLTSGYYYGEDRPLPENKCHHGGPFDSAVASFSSTANYVANGLALHVLGLYHVGINKDSLSCQWSPHSDLHQAAVDAAIAGSIQYIEDLQAKVSDDELRMLFGVGRVFAFVMDTTGSMTKIQTSVAQIAVSIADSLSSNEQGVGSFIISPFNDPDTGPVTVVTTIDDFKAYMDALPAAGGGDCPEYSMTGILNALEVIPSGAQLFLFTDAAPKDPDLANLVISTALEKNVNIQSFKFDSDCDDGIVLVKRSDSVSDSVYSRVSADTGGAYHSLPVSEIQNISPLVETLTAPDARPVLKINDVLNDTSVSYPLPVDANLTRLVISSRGNNVEITFKEPTQPTIGAPSTFNTTRSADGSITTIDNPTMGVWELVASGNSSFDVLVTGTSSLDFASFEFVASRGRPGHSGYFPIAESPPFNTDIGAIAEIDGNFVNATFELRSLAGTKIMSLPLSPGSGEYGFPRAESFFGTFRLPQQDALVYAVGSDAYGAPFQRVMTAVVSPVYSNLTYRLGTLDAYEQPDITLVQLNGTVNSTSTTRTGFSTSLHFTTASATTEAGKSTSTLTCPQNSAHKGHHEAPWKDWGGAADEVEPRPEPGCGPGELQSWLPFGRPYGPHRGPLLRNRQAH